MNIPAGYHHVPDTNKVAKIINSAKGIREVFGINPISKQAQRRYHAWYVSLPVRESFLEGFSRRDGVYTYAQNGDEASNRAAAFWLANVRHKKGLGDADFPKLVQYNLKDPETGSLAVNIDDQDFDSFWKIAKAMPHYKAGDPEGPITFMVSNNVDIFLLS